MVWMVMRLLVGLSNIMASIDEELKKSQEKLDEVKKQIRELKEIRTNTGLSFVQKNELLNLDNTQQELIKRIKRLYASL